MIVPIHSIPPAYFGPGAGFAFLGSFLSIVLAVLAGLVSALLWPFRAAWLLLMRRRGRRGRAHVRKAIFLGLDGLDPGVTEDLMDRGLLPNLARLRREGTYRRLRTTLPALSPVAWSTFATGVNPAKHNIFDFLTRDPENCAPELSSVKIHPAGKHSRASVEMRRKSEPFWSILGRHAVKSTILRVPVTFPPEPFNGLELSAMCAPDLLGTQGTHSRFRGPEGRLAGPEGTSVEFRVKDSGQAKRLEIQQQSVPLLRGEYTPWIRLRFGHVHGIVRFLPIEFDPETELYATPVQIDPENPALPISHPPYYAAYLAKLLGTFATLGLAEDMWALNEGAIGPEAFLRQTDWIREEREAMFFSALERTRRGVVACVFDTTDRVQHMFFGNRDVIERVYSDMDRIVGETLARAGPDTAVFVLSDHGFCSFRRGVNLNSWLLREGYLALAPDRAESGDYFEGVDWSRTRAYGLGLGGLYLNLEGRERNGIVAPGEAEALRRELRAKLTGLRDEETGELAIRAVYDAHEVYKGPYIAAAPDLLVGYADGYRASWDGASGKAGAVVIEENRKAWHGDHCVDPSLVPGVLFSNIALDAEDPGIEDLAPTALGLFGIQAPDWMEGRSLVAAV
jgi:predicted AlkP superfamily phosphohydrolase/phosphomutase